MRRTQALILASLFGLLAVTVHSVGVPQSNAKRVKLATLEWPPYTTQSLEGAGPITSLVRRTLISAGYTPKIEFYPWARVVRMASSGESEIEGYFPEYYAEDISNTFIFSEAIGGGWLIFVERKDKPIPWNTLGDLAPYTIGVVQDYVNTEDFDNAVASGVLRVEAVSTDSQNLRKLLAGRIDLAVIDELVFLHLLNTDASLSKGHQRLQINAHKLEYKQLYLCLRRTAENEKRMRSFNQALKQIRPK